MSADITKPETWYGLKLGEIVHCDDKIGKSSIERVPGGWLYWFDGKATFIPFSLEFCSIEHLPLVQQTQTSFAGEKNNA